VKKQQKFNARGRIAPTLFNARGRILFSFLLGILVTIPVAQADKLSSKPIGEYLPANLFVELSKRVNPAVVNISTTQIIRGRSFGGGGGFGGGGAPGMPVDPFEDFFGQFMGGGRGGFRTPDQKVQSLGSGFIIDASGLIVTNNHVIKNASDIQVQLTEKSKKTYKAKVIGSDERTDIALIKIDAGKTPLTIVPLGDSDKVEVGEWVAAFGNPLGHGHSISKGIISAKDRDIELENASYPFLQTDTNINPGNSGGPLVSTAGEVIGVNAAIDARGQGIGFAIPINVVKKLLPDLKTKGKITRGFLGIGLSDIDERIAKQLKISTDKGALVVSVAPGSPADKGGIEAYDVITEYDGQEIDSARSLTNRVGETPVGLTAKVKVIRKGKVEKLTIKIAERPDEMAMGKGSRGGGADEEGRPSHPGMVAASKFGMSFMDLTPYVAQQLKLSDAPKKGVVIVEVKQGGLAEQAGIQPGDILLDVNRGAVKNAKDVSAKLKKLTSGTLNFRILRGDATLLAFIELDE
jgi:serine protease Do